MSSNKVLTASILALSIAGSAGGQTQGYESFRRATGQALTSPPPSEKAATAGPSRQDVAAATDYFFSDRKDSLNWAKNRSLAAKSWGFRIIVSLQEKHLWVVTDDDTLLSAPVAVAKGNTLSYAGKAFTFKTPRGMRQVLGKDADPIWTPPEWLYIETAQEYGLQFERIPSKGSLTMPDGRKLTVQDNQVKVIDNGEVTNFPPELHLIFDKTLYIPPVGTENRQVKGTLGKFKLNLGEGYLLHGTNQPGSIGLAATHGCIRLRDEDIEWLYDNVPVGTKVFIY